MTMSIMAGARIEDPDMGCATGFVSHVTGPLIREIAGKRIRVVSNAGGAAPLEVPEALARGPREG